MGMKGKNVSSILQTFFVTHKHAQWIIGKRIQKNERVCWNQTGCGCHGSMEIMSNFLIRLAGGIYCHTQLGTCTGNESCFYFVFFFCFILIVFWARCSLCWLLHQATWSDRGLQFSYSYRATGFIFPGKMYVTPCELLEQKGAWW